MTKPEVVYVSAAMQVAIRSDGEIFLKRWRARGRDHALYRKARSQWCRTESKELPGCIGLELAKCKPPFIEFREARMMKVEDYQLNNYNIPPYEGSK